MYLRAVARSAVRSLYANLGRSLLTILGIVIGIVAIVLVITLGQGAQQLILQEVESIGANTVIVRPGRQPSGPQDAAETILSDSLKDREIQALMRKENVPNAVSVNPAVLVPGTLSREDNAFRATTLGWTAHAMQEVFKIEPEEGAYFTDEEIRQRAKVVVIGWRVKQELFGDSDAIGQTIRLRDHTLQVVGIFPKRGQVTFFNLDELALIPYSTAQRTILGIDHYHEIFIRVDTEENADLVAQDTAATLRELHGITDPEKDDFYITTQAEAVELISTVTQVLTIFLVAIASISLVVGGVGIMNIMLVSVTERTHEIGLRKALGATNRDILTQFLTEAILLTGFGGILGSTIAVSLAGLAAVVIRTQFNLNWPFTFPINAILLGVGVSTAIGIIFGLYPARKAAKKDPIEALRYE